MPTKLTDEEILEKYKQQRAKQDIYHAEWREKNREHVNAKQREWYANNKDRAKKYQLTYKERHKEKLAAQKEHEKAVRNRMIELYGF